MSRFCARLLIFVCLLPACSGLPVLQPAPDIGAPVAADACRAVFPTGKWQFVHTIDALLPDGSERQMMGVTVADAPGRTLACALLTVEGFVLFRARMDPAVRVERAVPPFDKKGFADGLLNDLRLLFLPPAAAETRIGRLVGGGFPEKPEACRYIEKEGAVTDVIPGSRWRVYRYSPHGYLVRTVTAEAAGGREGFPGRLTLQAPGLAGYTLVMTLVEAARINH